jgi:hypothetical protein
VEGIILLFVVLGIIVVGMDFVFKAFGLGLHAWYRGLLKRVYKKIVRKLRALVKWAWTNYKQFIIGFAVGLLVAFLLSQPQ